MVFSYAELRAYTGNETRLQLDDGYIVVRQGNAADNGGTVWKDALGRSWERQFSGPIDIRWFGAVADWNGATGTDNTVAINKALSAARGIYGTGRSVLVPDGKFLCGDIDILTTGIVLTGESKYGSWLVAKQGATHILDIGSVTTPAREVVIEKLSLDYTLMADSVDNAAIRFKNSYGNALRDVVIVADNDNTRDAFGLYYGIGTYTTLTENVSCKKIRIYSHTADRPTTLTFTSVDFGIVDINNAGAITFIQPVGQSTVSRSYGPYRVKVVNCFSFTALGGDYEDDDPSHFIYYLDNVTHHLVSIGNWTTGFAGGYAAYGPTGIPASCKAFLQDDKTKGFEYREGSWTPALAWSTPGTSTIVPSSANGRYVKNGNLVTCSFNLDDVTFTNGTAGGYLILGGLPFVPKTYPTDMQGGSITLQIGFPTSLQSIQVSATDPIAFFKKSDGLGGSIVVADVSGSGKYLRGTFTYQCVN